MSEALFADALKKPSDFSSARVQELNDLKEFFKIQQGIYTKYKILADTLQEYAFHNEPLDNLKTKVQDVILEHNCEQLLDLQVEDCSHLTSKLLGLSFTEKTELNHEEASNLNKCINSLLEAKYKNICDQFLKITGDCILKLPASSDVTDFGLSSEEQFFLEMTRKVEEQQQKYVKNLLELMKLLENIAEVRLKRLPEACDNKLKECQMKSCISEVQMKIIREKIRIDIFAKSTNTLPAYQEFIKDVKEQQDECKQEVQHLKNLKKKYGQVFCKQYDDILKEYIQYKTSLVKKKMILESLHK